MAAFDINNNQWVTIRVRSKYGDVVNEETRRIRIVKSMLEGWPIKSDQIASGYTKYNTIIDLDNDGKKEIVAPFSYLQSTSYKEWIPSFSLSHPKVFVFSCSGETVSTFLENEVRVPVGSDVDATAHPQLTAFLYELAE